MLGNLFLHSVFDVWLETGFPGVPYSIRMTLSATAAASDKP
ncbi:hypothetical protein BHMPCIPO_06223 [Ensifer sesbaniae]|nr:hypothetical protein [Ensifer sesbaniae]